MEPLSEEFPGDEGEVECRDDVVNSSTGGLKIKKVKM
jgi:hypothetical protein